MVKLVCFDSSKLGPELIDNKLVSFVPIIMIKNNGMTQMHGGGEKVRNREDVLDPGFRSTVNILAKHNRGLLEIGNLTGQIAELLEDIANVGSLLHRGFATENKIISKEKGVDGRAALTKSNS